MVKIVCALSNRQLRLPFVVLSCFLALFGELALGAEPKVAVSVKQNDAAFIVDVTLDVQVSSATAWEVLTDFDHMTSILGNLSSSKVTARDGNICKVRQEGVARHGLLSFPFVSEREIRLEPMTRILARNLSGTLRRMESEAKILPLDQGVQIVYRAEIDPGSLLARMFGEFFVRHETEEQFLGMAREMTRRHAHAEPVNSTAGLPAR